MTPQSSFMLQATIHPARGADLRRLLDSMNHAPGQVNAANDLVPFARFEKLHFGRFIILDDATLADITVYGLPQINFPKYLVFLGDVDGPTEAFLDELAATAEPGLRAIYSHCEDYQPEANLRTWLRRHNVSPAANYVNWVGRTVRQVREEEALRQSLEAYIQSNRTTIEDTPPRQVNDVLRRFVTGERKAGRLVLTPPEPTPLAWQIRNAAHLIGLPLLLVLLSPILLLYLPIFLVQLRRREDADPEIAPRVDAAHAEQLAAIEDQDVTNQFSAMGSLKPGRFRRLTISAVLLAIDYTARHIFNRGKLARVTTIHFARWVFLDGGKRVIFASNYDGSLESYMDDFINKVGFGLNVVFSAGIGYPRTRWLILDGAKDEQRFKYYLRRHQMPTQVWYKAYPGLTAHDLKRNSLLRAGVDGSSLSDSDLQTWLTLL